MVRFLGDCEQLLKNDGVLILAVPDKRFCGDFFRPLTSTGQIVQAYLEKLDRHSIGSVFDSWSLLTRNGGLQSWQKNNLPTELRLCSSPEVALEKAEAALSSKDYIDAHEWCFTPSNFRLIFSDLQKLSLSGLQEDKFINGLSCEFFVKLRKNIKNVSDVDRINLSKLCFDESAAVSPAGLERIVSGSMSV